MIRILTIISSLIAFAAAQAQEVRGIELIESTTFLVPPDSLIQLQPTPSISPRWTFEDQTKDEVIQFLEGLELPESATAHIAQARAWNPVEFGVQFFPTSQMIRDLPETTRSAIYRRLAESDLNPFQQQPFLFGADVKTWFRDSEISPDLVAEIEQLTYPIGKVRAFSDLSTVLAHAAELNQERELMRTVYGSPSRILNVRWPGNLDWEGWIEFWTASGRNVDHVPFLEALRRNPAVGSVDLIHLLPPNARKRLNTWPSLSAGMNGVFPNSFSSAMRFFQISVPDTAIDPDRVVVLLDRGYEKIESPYRFGDVLLYNVEGDTTPVHANVFIAEDLVYTKLSRSVMRPWVVMKMDEVQPFFEPADGRKLLTQGWRKLPPKE
ncbi:MAG: hypothetical protein ACI8UO_003091 [Verrucomicrobiales bacterium]|jgi:hypothetical protein